MNIASILKSFPSFYPVPGMTITLFIPIASNAWSLFSFMLLAH